MLIHALIGVDQIGQEGVHQPLHHAEKELQEANQEHATAVLRWRRFGQTVSVHAQPWWNELDQKQEYQCFTLAHSVFTQPKQINECTGNKII